MSCCGGGDSGDGDGIEERVERVEQQQQRPAIIATTAAPELPLPVHRPIRALDESVVNRIAAGEVLQRPSNAVKELLENALDARSTRVTIKLQRGGLDRITITDNGHGIAKEDMPLACARFATSKIGTADDLNNLSTYGFRGEALASISHVARISIYSRTPGAKCAWRARYSDGVIVPFDSASTEAKVELCAGNDGTTIVVEDLFYNVPARRRAISNPAAEYQKTLSMVQKYAILAAGKCAISCAHSTQGAQPGAPAASLTTQLRTPSNSGEDLLARPGDIIRMLYGSSIARELLEIVDERRTSESSTMAQLKIVRVEAHFTNANFSQRHTTNTTSTSAVHMQHNVRHRVASNLRHSGDFILFVNHRLVESQFLKRAIDNVYAPLLPKHARPFVFLSLDMEPGSVDANVHPTKAEVHVLEEEKVFEFVASRFQGLLASGNRSRNFVAQSSTSTTTFVAKDAEITIANNSRSSASSSSSGQVSKRQDDGGSEQSGVRKRSYVDQSRLVRSDSKMQKLTHFFPPPSDSKREPERNGSALPQRSSVSRSNSAEVPSFRLASIARIYHKHTVTFGHKRLGEVLKDATFVGSFTEPVAREGGVSQILPSILFQHGTELWMVVVTPALLTSVCLQRVLRFFGRLPALQLETPLSLTSLVEAGLQLTVFGDDSPIPVASLDNARRLVVNNLVPYTDMLSEYLSLELRSVLSADGSTVDLDLVGLPRVLNVGHSDGESLDEARTLIQGNCIAWDLLPYFFCKLCSCVANWSDEESCLESLCILQAEFTARSVFALHESADAQAFWTNTLEHGLFPILCDGYFTPLSAHVSDGSFVPLASLEKLYRVFERC